MASPHWRLLGWEFQDGTLQAKGGLFPWHDESHRGLFDRLSEEGVDRVQETLGKLRVSQARSLGKAL